MIVDTISNWRAYDLGEAWKAVFKFLEELDASAEDKEYPILGDQVFARVMSYATKLENAPDAVLEAHQKFADVQMILEGAERIGVYPGSSLEIKTAYMADRDVEFYTYTRPADFQLKMHPGSFALLLPQDAHMPGLSLEAPGTMVKKVVVKIAMDLLEL